MKKILSFIILLFSIVQLNAQSFSNPNPGTYGIKFNRVLADKNLHIPTICGDPNVLTGVNDNVTDRSSIVYDQCGQNFWVYDLTDRKWYKTIEAKGDVSQYIRGDGTLAQFTGGGGGGAGGGVVFYLNGGIGSDVALYSGIKEASQTPFIDQTNYIYGISNGVVARFMTDLNQPGVTSIRAGEWNVNLYISQGITTQTPSVNVGLYKYDGTTLTYIATSDNIAISGSGVNRYSTNILVPTLTLNTSDRFAFVINVSGLSNGNSIILNTQGTTLCSVSTSIPNGISTLNGLNSPTQYFGIGTSGNDFNISSANSIHTFNFPNASSTSRGLLTNIDWNAFNSKEPAISAGNSTQYWRGDKTWQTLNTTVVPEGSNLYYTTTRANTDFDTRLGTKSTTNLTEGTNLYHTDARSRSALSLTTNNSSGSATYSSTTGTFNIPTYTIGGLGGVPSTRNLTINGTTLDLSSDRTFNITSMVYPSAGIPLSTGTGWATSITDNSANWNTAYNNRITSATSPLNFNANTLSISQANTTTSGYLSSTDWNTFNNKQGALTITTTGTSGAATLTGNTLNIPQYSGGSSYTFSSPLVNTAGTVSIPISSSSTNGYLSSTDWATFNNKQNALSNPVTGTGAVNKLAIWNSSNSISSSQLTFMATGVGQDGFLGIGTSNPSTNLHINSSGPIIRLTNTIASSTAQSSISAFNSSVGYQDLVFSANGYKFFGGSNQYNYLTIDGTYGNVGINKSNPQYSLDVAGWFRAYNNAIVGGRLLVNTTTDDGTNNVQVNGSVAINSLAGTGNRMVITDASGVLSTQTIPATVSSLQPADVTALVAMTDPGKIIVSSAIGDDVNGTGSSSIPYATISKGMAKLASPGMMELSGTFNEPVNCNYSMSGVFIDFKGSTINGSIIHNGACSNMTYKNANVVSTGNVWYTTGSGTFTNGSSSTIMLASGSYNAGNQGAPSVGDYVSYNNGSAWVTIGKITAINIGANTATILATATATVASNSPIFGTNNTSRNCAVSGVVIGNVLALTNAAPTLSLQVGSTVYLANSGYWMVTQVGTNYTVVACKYNNTTPGTSSYGWVAQPIIDYSSNDLGGHVFEDMEFQGYGQLFVHSGNMNYGNTFRHCIALTPNSIGYQVGSLASGQTHQVRDSRGFAVSLSTTSSHKWLVDAASAVELIGASAISFTFSTPISQVNQILAQQSDLNTLASNLGSNSIGWYLLNFTSPTLPSGWTSSGTTIQAGSFLYNTGSKLYIVANPAAGISSITAVSGSARQTWVLAGNNTNLYEPVGINAPSHIGSQISAGVLQPIYATDGVGSALTKLESVSKLRIAYPVTLGNFNTDGGLGTAANTVDITSHIYVNQITTGNKSLQIPTPTDATKTYEVTLFNIGTAAFFCHGAYVLPNAQQKYTWVPTLNRWVVYSQAPTVYGVYQFIGLSSNADPDGNYYAQPIDKLFRFAAADAQRDPYNMVSVADNTRLYPPVSGIYRISFYGNVNPQSSGTGQVNMQVRVNDQPISLTQKEQVLNSPSNITIAGDCPLVYVPNGGYINLTIYASNKAQVSMNNTYTGSISIQKISD